MSVRSLSAPRSRSAPSSGRTATLVARAVIASLLFSLVGARSQGIHARWRQVAKPSRVNATYHNKLAPEEPVTNRHKLRIRVSRAARFGGSQSGQNDRGAVRVMLESRGCGAIWVHSHDGGLALWEGAVPHLAVRRAGGRWGGRNRTRMIVGIPKEIKDNENRVSTTPAGVAEYVGRGHQVP